jgi:hypothetical protein
MPAEQKGIVHKGNALFNAILKDAYAPSTLLTFPFMSVHA